MTAKGRYNSLTNHHIVVTRGISRGALHIHNTVLSLILALHKESERDYSYKYKISAITISGAVNVKTMFTRT